MSELLNQVRTRLEKFKRSPIGYGAKLRLDFAEIIWRHIEDNEWSQRKLARKVGLADSVVSNLIHGNKNCTLDTVGKVIHALGTEATLQEKVPGVEVASDYFLRYHGMSGEPIEISFKETSSVQTSTYSIQASAEI